MFKSTEKETTVPSFKFVSKLTIFSSRQVCKKHLYNLSLTSKNCQRHPSNCAFSLCFYNYFWHYTRMQSWISKASSLNITSKKTSLTLCWTKPWKNRLTAKHLNAWYIWSMTRHINWKLYLQQIHHHRSNNETFYLLAQLQKKQCYVQVHATFK